VFGDVEWAVRLPAVISSAIGAVCVAGLARAVFRDGRVGFFSAAVLMSMPAHHAVSTLMTIDGPYLACWAAACWCGWHAFTGEGRGRVRAWAGLGAAIGVGFLFKYTILILPLGMLAFIIAARKSIPRPRGYEIAVGLGVALLGLVPVVVWNAQNDWVTVRHLLGHLGLPGGDTPPSTDTSAGWSYDPMWTLEFLGLQLAAGGPTLVLALLGIVNLFRKSHRAARAEHGSPSPEPGAPAFLLFIAAPMFVFYGLVTLVTNVEANWTVAGFVTLAPIAGWAAVDAHLRTDRPLRAARDASFICFALFVIAIPTAGWLGSNVGRGIFPGLNRVMQADEMALQAVAEAEEHLAGEGEPFYMTVHYGRASLLAFYLPGQPRVYAAQSLLGGRKTQYDMWPETDLRNPETIESLLGRPAVLMGGTTELWNPAFDEVVDRGRLPADPKADRRTFTARGFRGFAGGG
jgi:hypothetical protein